MGKRALGPVAEGNCRLRLLEEGDIERLRLWRNQEHIRRWFVDQRMVAPEEQRRWWAGHRERDDDFIFVIEETEEGLGPVGIVSLYHVDWEGGHAEYGRLLLGEAAARGKGLARRATQLLLDLAFATLGLREVHLEVFRDNAPAIRIYRDCGFVETGGDERLLKMALRR